MGHKAYLRSEKGLVMVVTLLVLMALTVMGLTAITTTTTEVKISGNERANSQAIQTAEAGVKEVLYRMGLPDGQGGIDVANGGSGVTVDGYSFDAHIGDPGISPVDCLTAPCPDPDWTTALFFTSTDPGDPNGNTIYSRTVLPQDKWGSFNYATGDTNDTEYAVTIRYARESDYVGLDDINATNNDGDLNDLVFYDRQAGKRRGAEDDGANGDVEMNPPAVYGLNNNNTIMLITSTGQNGNAKKTVQLEFTGFQLDPAVPGAFTVGAAVDLKGNGFISGYNHKQDTTKANYSDQVAGDYQTDGCDNKDVKKDLGGTGGGCGFAIDPEASEMAPYSQQWEGEGNVAGVYYPPALKGGPDEPEGESSAEIWGGSDVDSGTGLGTNGWKNTDPGWTFPELHDMMGITQAELQTVLDNADVTETSSGACPIGVTYIQNKGGSTWSPKCDSGHGLLVVEGDYQAAGQFEFRGLVYVKGHARLRGGSFYLGGVAVKGETTGSQKVAGTPTILYSKQTLINEITAVAGQGAQGFTYLSWKQY